MNFDPMSPVPSTEGMLYKPSTALTVPTVNSLDWNKDANTVTKPAEPETSKDDDGKPNWLLLARNAFDSSDSWMQVNLRQLWARNLSHYASEHAAGSPALSDANKHRSSYFWPKTRTLVRAIQSAVASAYFTSSDVVAIDAEDQDDEGQVAAAALMKALLNYRLTRTIPWYQIVLGAAQEASVLGTVISHQYWDYRERETHLGYEVDSETGETVELYETKVLSDKPAIRIAPAENIHISPASDWLDPINSSPYLIEKIPMFVGEVEAKVREGKDSKSGEPSWKDVGVNMLLGAATESVQDITRKARVGRGKLDPKTTQIESENAFKLIWIHRNIIRYDGEDWLFYTAGTTIMLSDPVRLTEVIPWADGKRDYACGKMEVEVDKVYASSPVEIIGGMQRAVNELKNQRYDNVRQVLNRRYLYRAGATVDIRALHNNVPGGLISVAGAGPLDSHVIPLATPDVTSSSYQEEDRISLAMDDLSGSTTGSTVNSNRKMNETVGGMQMMQEAGNMVREMELRTLTKTWTETCLTQIVQLEAMYETDVTVLTVAAKSAKLSAVYLEYFDHKFPVSVNVGMGAVSPTQRLQKITQAVSTVVQLVPDAAAAIDGAAVAKEVFGAAGFDNGARFFNFAKVEAQKANPQADPQLELAKQQLEQKGKIEQGKQEVAQGRLQLELEKLKLQNREMEAKVALLTAQKVTENVNAVYEASQVAGVILQNPGAAPMIDETLASAGFKDQNGAPVVSEPAQTGTTEPQVAVNTHPNLPAKPVSAGIGARKGIETPTLGD